MWTHVILPITNDDNQPNSQNSDSKIEYTETTNPDNQDNIANPQAARKDDNHDTVTITLIQNTHAR